jgi:CheY-like chemotaxis protein
MAHQLLVDDDDDTVAAFAELLREEGHQVHSASTGEEGLTVLRGSPLPDALILDVDMPILGGPGMAHEMLLHDAERKTFQSSSSLLARTCQRSPGRWERRTSFRSRRRSLSFST